MKKFILLCLFSALVLFQLSAQEKEDIVAIIDGLTLKWDDGAEKMSSYDGLRDYCRVKPYRDKTADLLNQIHHYDTVLYLIVQQKYDEDKDKEAKATIDDIEKLESEYTTKSFLIFLRQECNKLNEIENNLGKSKGSEYEHDVKALEKELKKYVSAITKQIDVIDEHVHHLSGL